MARMAVSRALAAAAAVRCSLALTFDAEGAKNRPVTKVIKLLKEMGVQLQKDADNDQEIYEKMACWCQTNDREKTKSIANAETHIGHLTTNVEELTASSSELGTQKENLDKEVAKNQESLEQATALREKDLAEFTAEEKDLTESIMSLKAAVTVLSKHHEPGFLQMQSTQLAGAAASVEHTMAKHANLLAGVLTISERKTMAAFIQQPAGYKSYNSQSGGIYGILNQMLESFKSNLDSLQKDEAKGLGEFQGLEAAKVTEIKTGQDQIDKKSENKANTDEETATSKQDMEDTKASLSADEQFLSNLKEKCQMTDSEWEARQKTRQLEMQAVAKALEVLTSDDSHDLFTKTFNSALIQTGAVDSGSRRAKASSVLGAAAAEFHSPRLATLAYQVKLDAFVRVKKAIDEMISDLTKEKEDEIKHKDFCVEEFNSNDKQTVTKGRDKDDLISTIEGLDASIETLVDEIGGLKGDIEEMQVQLKQAGEDRETANKEFQVTVADQRETHRVLKSALGVLADYYKKTALLQAKQEPAGPAAPAGFDTYANNAGGGGVMQMITQIMTDAKALEAESIRGEEDAQKAYEDFVKDTNGSVDAKNNDILNKSENKAKQEGNRVQANEEKESTLLELEQLGNSKSQLHQSCDFVMTNFEVRQTARDEEVEALNQAKAILSGSDFGNFLQKS